MPICVFIVSDESILNIFGAFFESCHMVDSLSA